MEPASKRINGKPCNIGLGPFPIVNLAEAREAALENARAVYQGHDPRKGSATPSFDKASEIVIEMHASTWRNPRTADIWRSSFRRFVSPMIGSKPIGAVTSADILSVLTPIWNGGKQETARRLRHRIGAVMRWSIGAGHRSDNPAGDAVSQVLPKNGTAPRRHRRALHHRDVSPALAKIRASAAWQGNQAAYRVRDLDGGSTGRGSACHLERGGSTGRGVDLDCRENEVRP